MTYQLTKEEMELVRDMVRILTNAYDSREFLGTEEEKELFRLANELDKAIR